MSGADQQPAGSAMVGPVPRVVVALGRPSPGRGAGTLSWSGAAGPICAGHQDGRALARRSAASRWKWPATTRPGGTAGSAAS